MALSDSASRIMVVQHIWV